MKKNYAGGSFRYHLDFSKVVAKYPNYVLKMAGDGVLLNTCENLVTHLGIENNVQFLGVVNPEEYIRELQNSLAFVQHSITADNGDMEGTPLAVLEASAAGVPVVSTYHAGIPDVIIHEQTSLLCEEKDVQKMAKNLILVYIFQKFKKHLISRYQPLDFYNHSNLQHSLILHFLIAPALLIKESSVCFYISLILLFSSKIRKQIWSKIH